MMTEVKPGTAGDDVLEPKREQTDDVFDLSAWPIDVVLDTNSMIEAVSLYDINRAVVDGRDAKFIAYKWRRQRDALMLSLFLHDLKLQTFSLYESIRKLESLIPREQKPGTDPDHDFLVFHTHVVHNALLSEWKPHVPVPPETVRGTPADRLLVETARRSALPLITTEGVTPDGVVDQGMRKRAKTAGVQVFSPHEFFSSKCNEGALAYSFMERLAEMRPKEAARRLAVFGADDRGDDLFQMVQNAYRALLFGAAQT